jgi:hypothetical protein
MGAEVEVEQSMNLRIDNKNNVAAASSVATIGSAERLKFFPVYRGATVSTVTGSNM